MLRKRINVRDVVNAVGSVCLAPHFEDIAPKYPSFSLLITTANRDLATMDALKSIAGGARTKLSTADFLEALELLDGERLDSSKSQFAMSVVESTLKKEGPTDSVVNQERTCSRGAWSRILCP